MEVKLEKEAELNIVIVSGRLDSLTASRFKAKMDSIIENDPGDILLDFSSLLYISSAGLAALLTIAKIMKRSGHILALCSLNDIVRKVFDMAGFSPLFKIYKDRSSAVYQLNNTI